MIYDVDVALSWKPSLLSRRYRIADSTNLAVMSDSGEPSVEPGSSAGPSAGGIIEQDVQPQPPETTAAGDEESSSSAACPVQPESERQSVVQSTVVDDYNYVRMPYSEDPTARKRRSNVRLSVTCYKK